MKVSDNFQRPNNLSLGPNWSSPVPFSTGPTGFGTGTIQLLNNAFAPTSSAGGAALSVWAADGFANDQYASAQISVVAPFTSVVAITAATLSGGNTIYNYTLSSGSALTVNQQIYVTGMAHAGNNGNFQITGLGGGTFTVVNASGFTATESGTGNSPSDSNVGLVVRGSTDGLNAYVLYVGTNSGLVGNGGVFAGADNRTQDVELWRIVNGVATFMAGNGGIPYTPLAVNDVFTLIASGITLVVIQNSVQIFKTTDSSVASGTPGIMVWSTAPPGEWANPTTYGAGNSAMQMTNWVGGDDNYTFTQLASDTLKEGTSSTQVSVDPFTRANGSLGANWVSSVGTLQIVSNKVLATTNNTRNAAYWGGGQTFNNDQYAEATIAVMNGTALGGPSVRTAFTGVNGVTGETGYILLVPATGVSGNLLVQRMINGASATILTIPTITPVVGDVFRISIAGTTITAFQNGVSKGTIVDANLTKGFPGIFCFAPTTSTDCQLSSWAAGGVGLPTTFTTLPNQNWQSDSVNGASPNTIDSSVYAAAWQNVISPSADQYAEAKVTSAAIGTGPAIRISTAADTAYALILGFANTAKLIKIVAGVTTVLGQAIYVFNNGDMFRVEALGSIITAKINGVIQLVASDSAIAAGKFGLVGVAAGTTQTFSNWAGGNVVIVGPPTLGTLSLGSYNGISLSTAIANPSSLDIIQILSEGGRVVWNLDKNGVATINPTTPTRGALNTFFGANFQSSFSPNPQSLDIFQVVGQGGKVVFSVDSQGNAGNH